MTVSAIVLDARDARETKEMLKNLAYVDDVIMITSRSGIAVISSVQPEPKLVAVQPNNVN